MRRGCRCPVMPWRADGGAILAGGTAGASVDRGAAAAFVGLHLEGWRAVASSIGTGHVSTGYGGRVPCHGVSRPTWGKCAQIGGKCGAKRANLR